MGRISDLSDELLIKILSCAPTKVAVSTSILSKQWESLWTWVPKLDYELTKYKSNPEPQDIIGKCQAHEIESLSLEIRTQSFQHEDIKQWVDIAASRCLRELSIDYLPSGENGDVILPSSLYTCESLVTLKLVGGMLVDVRRTVCLPSLKTLHLQDLIYLNDASLRLLLSYCPVLEDLWIERQNKDDNVNALVVIVPTLQHLTLIIGSHCPDDHGFVIATPSLKYFKVDDNRDNISYLVEDMPELEEADIEVQNSLEKLLEPMTSVKRLSLRAFLFYSEEHVYRDGIVFNQLEHLKLNIYGDEWAEFLVRLLKDSPNLRVLKLDVDSHSEEYYESRCWNDDQSSVPKCLSKSLDVFEFKGYSGSTEERDFLSFFFKNAHCLKSSSILATSY